MAEEYIITAPIYGCASIIVEADSEQEARRKFDEGDYTGTWEVDEFEVGQGGCEGNVCHRMHHDEIIIQPN